MNNSVCEPRPIESLSACALGDIAALEHPFDEAAGAHIAQRIESLPEVAQARRAAARRRALVVLVAAAFVVLAGFTAYDRVAALWNDWAGVTGVAEFSEPVGSVAVDQGIRAEVESALSDGYATYFLVSFIDEEGERVSDEMGFGHWVAYGGSTSYAGSCEFFGYDEETGAARYLFQVDGDMTGVDGFVELYTLMVGEFSCFSFQDGIDLAALAPDEGTFVDFAWDLTGYTDSERNGYVQETYLSSPSKETDEREALVGQVLEPDVMHVELADAAGAYLSNVAYRDGKLYAQLSTTMGARGDQMIMLGLYDRQTRESLGVEPDAISYRYREWEDGSHQDIYQVAFEVPYEKLGDCVLLATGHGQKDIIEGNWRFSFSIPASGTPYVEADTQVPVEGGEINYVKVTPFSVMYEGDADTPITQVRTEEGVFETGGDLEYPSIVLVYADETRVEVGGTGGWGWADPDGIHHVHGFVTPVERFDELVAVEMNGVLVELE